MEKQADVITNRWQMLHVCACVCPWVSVCMSVCVFGGRVSCVCVFIFVAVLVRVCVRLAECLPLCHCVCLPLIPSVCVIVCRQQVRSGGESGRPGVHSGRSLRASHHHLRPRQRQHQGWAQHESLQTVLQVALGRTNRAKHKR